MGRTARTSGLVLSCSGFLVPTSAWRRASSASSPLSPLTIFGILSEVDVTAASVGVGGVS